MLILFYESHAFHSLKTYFYMINKYFLKDKKYNMKISIFLFGRAESEIGEFTNCSLSPVPWTGEPGQIYFLHSHFWGWGRLSVHILLLHNWMILRIFFQSLNFFSILKILIMFNTIFIEVFSDRLHKECYRYLAPE